MHGSVIDKVVDDIKVISEEFLQFDDARDASGSIRRISCVKIAAGVVIFIIVIHSVSDFVCSDFISSRDVSAEIPAIYII